MPVMVLMMMIRNEMAMAVGREHACLVGNLRSKNDAAVKANNNLFTLGPVVSLQSFVDKPRTICRQYYTHADDRKYDLEQSSDTIIDGVATGHHHMAILLGEVIVI